MSKDIGIGVIGAGGRGGGKWGLAQHIHRPGQGSRIVAAMDIYDDELERFADSFGRDVLLTKDYHELLACPDVDAVLVASPDWCHEEHAVAALNARKAVYLEKPMAISIAGCDRILRAAWENRVKLYVGHNMRHMDFVRTMRRLITEGRIGQVKAGWCRHFIAYGGDAYFKDWHAERQYANSLLLQKASHDIDVLHWLCGGYTRRVVGMGGLVLYDQITNRHAPDDRGNSAWHEANWPPLTATGMNPVIDVEDLSMMLMELDNGVSCSYQQCHFTPDAWRNYCIIGTEGRVENCGDEPGNCTVRLWNKRYPYREAGDEQFVIAPTEGTHGGADAKIMAEWVRYVREGGKVCTSPIAARMSVAAGCLATDSLRGGNAPHDMPPLPKEIVEYFQADLAD